MAGQAATAASPFSAASNMATCGAGAQAASRRSAAASSARRIGYGPPRNCLMTATVSGAIPRTAATCACTAVA